MGFDEALRIELEVTTIYLAQVSCWVDHSNILPQLFQIHFSFFKYKYHKNRKRKNYKEEKVYSLFL